MIYGNGRGGMGVAPGASLNGYNYLASQTAASQVAALGGSSSNPASSDARVFNQSYGMNNNADIPVDPATEAQYAYGVASLGGGRGALYVKAAGNGFRQFGQAYCGGAQSIGVTCQNASMDPVNTLPYNIVVGALNASEVRSSYSTAGSAIWVSAPGGEFGNNASTAGAGGTPQQYMPAMVTTDQSGCTAGYSRTGVTSSTFAAGGAPNTACNYTNTFNGTSSATPVTSGALALILETNPSLGWRDVKHILASTSAQIDPGRGAVTDPTVAEGPYVAELPWTTNAAGYQFHNWYGFGRIDVDRAVEMARTYAYGQLGTFRDGGWRSSGVVALPIPDNSATGVTSAVEIPQADDLVVEAIQVRVTADHPSAGDLGIELVSPSGMKSILLNIKNGFAANGTAGLQGMVLESNAFYGERSAGRWTLRVVDGWANDTGTLSNWQIRVFGH